MNALGSLLSRLVYPGPTLPQHCPGQQHTGPTQQHPGHTHPQQYPSPYPTGPQTLTQAPQRSPQNNREVEGSTLSASWQAGHPASLALAQTDRAGSGGDSRFLSDRFSSNVSDPASLAGAQAAWAGKGVPLVAGKGACTRAGRGAGSRVVGGHAARVVGEALPSMVRGRVLQSLELRRSSQNSASRLRAPFQNSGSDLRRPFRVYAESPDAEERGCEGAACLEDAAASLDTRPFYTVDDALTSLGFGRFQWLLLGYTALAWAAEAMELLLLSFIGPAAAAEWGLQAGQEASLSSVVFVGMLVGAYSWGILADSKGRRVGFAVTALLTVFAGLASAAAPSFATLLVMRALVGVGLGGAPVVFSLFMEFVPPPERGFWLIGVSVFWTAGSILEAGLAWAVLPTLGWRWLVAFSAAPFLLLLLFFPLLPESPRFLLTQGRPLDAQEVLKRIAALNKRPLPSGQLVLSLPGSSEGLLSGAAAVEESRAKGPGAPGLGAGQIPLLASSSQGLLSGAAQRLALLFSPPLRRTTVLLWAVFFASAFSYYGFVLLTTQVSSSLSQACLSDMAAADVANAGDAASSKGGAYLDVLVTSAGELPGLLAAAFLVDRIGRKRTMASMLFGASLSSFALLAILGAPPPPIVPPSLSSATTAVADIAAASADVTATFGGFVDSVAGTGAGAGVGGVAAGAAAAAAAAAGAGAGAGDPGFTPWLAALGIPGVTQGSVVVLVLFLARACVMGAFQTVFAYAPEVYPTSMRTTGLGAASSFSRLGGVACPYVAVNLIRSCNQGTAFALFGVVPLLASFAALAFTVETSKKELCEDVEVPPSDGM